MSARFDILHRFDTFTVSPEQRQAMEDTRVTFKGIARGVLERTKPGREQSLALTALEEARYYTSQSIAKDGLPDTDIYTTEATA